MTDPLIPFPALGTSRPAPSGPSGAFRPGFAQAAVSQAAAMAVQDAGSYLRQLSILSSAAVAVCTAKLVETQSPEPWGGVLDRVGENMVKASGVLKQVGSDAASVIHAFTQEP